MKCGKFMNNNNNFKKNQGFTLAEVLAVLVIIGILAGLATPSLLQLNKPLKRGTLMLSSHLSLLRAKAISTGKAHRLVMKYPVAGGYAPTESSLRSQLAVEFNDSCRSTSGWKPANGLDLNLPDRVNLFQHNALNLGNICFDSRGGSPLGTVYHVGVASEKCEIYLEDFNGNSKALVSRITIRLGGQILVETFERDGAVLYKVDLDGNGNAVY
jgi:prepilin-type N-terminal cleavage/methylation domain-containing protein